MEKIMEKLEKLEEITQVINKKLKALEFNQVKTLALLEKGKRSKLNKNSAWLFLNEAIEYDFDGAIDCKALFDVYLQYCKANSYHPINNVHFGKMLNITFPKRHKKQRLNDHGIRTSCYLGLRFSPDFSPFSKGLGIDIDVIINPPVAPVAPKGLGIDIDPITGIPTQ